MRMIETRLGVRGVVCVDGPRDDVDQGDALRIDVRLLGPNDRNTDDAPGQLVRVVVERDDLNGHTIVAFDLRPDQFAAIAALTDLIRL